MKKQPPNDANADYMYVKNDTLHLLMTVLGYCGQSQQLLEEEENNDLKIIN